MHHLLGIDNSNDALSSTNMAPPRPHLFVAWFSFKVTASKYNFVLLPLPNIAPPPEYAVPF